MLYFQLVIMAGTVMLAYYFEYTDTFSVHVQGFFCYDTAYTKPYLGPEDSSAVPPVLLYAVVAGLPTLLVSSRPRRREKKASSSQASADGAGIISARRSADILQRKKEMWFFKSFGPTQQIERFCTCCLRPCGQSLLLLLQLFQKVSHLNPGYLLISPM